jgi:hypothetical protein
MTERFNDKEMQALKNHFDEQTCLNIVETYKTIIETMRQQAPSYKRQTGEQAINNLAVQLQKNLADMQSKWTHVDWGKNVDR